MRGNSTNSNLPLKLSWIELWLRRNVSWDLKQSISKNSRGRSKTPLASIRAASVRSVLCSRTRSTYSWKTFKSNWLNIRRIMTWWFITQKVSSQLTGKILSSVISRKKKCCSKSTGRLRNSFWPRKLYRWINWNTSFKWDSRCQRIISWKWRAITSWLTTVWLVNTCLSFKFRYKITLRHLFSKLRTKLGSRSATTSPCLMR